MGRKLDSQSVVVNLSSGAASGVVGAILGNPLFLVKARIQAYSPSHPVGAQHAYKGGFDALTSIFKAEGVRGLWRGVDAAMLRTAMGSSVSGFFILFLCCFHSSDTMWSFCTGPTASI